jgi:hypothetical protein
MRSLIRMRRTNWRVFSQVIWRRAFTHAQYVLSICISRIVARVHIVKPQRPNGRHLGYVFARFRPVKVGRVTRKNDDGARWISPQLVLIKVITQPNVEDPGNLVALTGIEPVF